MKNKKLRASATTTTDNRDTSSDILKEKTEIEKE
jgi:hypothetical protein